MSQKKMPSGYLSFVLHSHLPYVLNHGTWPHGEDWLYEAAAETYLPILRVCEELEQQGIALKANVNLSPILLEQLAHPRFKEGFTEYVLQKIDAAKKDEIDFGHRSETHYVEVAQFWNKYYTRAREHFERLGKDIIGAFKKFYDSGAIEIITCGATHGYFPLLGTDSAIRAQVRMGVQTHKRFFGRKPRGIWLPECGYRPAGEWQYPVPVDGTHKMQRVGVEQILAENEIEFFFVDTHLVESNVSFTPYEVMAGDVPVAAEVNGDGHASLYRPYYADTPYRDRAKVAFFARDPRTGIQVWSGEHGYPGEAEYLDFHKKRWPGGHRYWQVTHPKIDLGAKTAYFPERALARTRIHAQHFSDVAVSVLQEHAAVEKVPPILSAPFDAELFGHWWFEGPEWLKHVAEELNHPGHPLKLITCGEYLDAHRPEAFLALAEGSWGKNGNNDVWLNPETAWTWKHIYPAELAVQQVAESSRWRGHEAGSRLAKQICRELLLLESSDWQFLITTIAARDYAEKRFQNHLDDFRKLLDCWRRFEASGSISAEGMKALEEIEKRDSVFPQLTPEVYL
jgi:1,4-alpha-glucan branching enzyme